MQKIIKKMQSVNNLLIIPAGSDKYTKNKTKKHKTNNKTILFFLLFSCYRILLFSFEKRKRPPASSGIIIPSTKNCVMFRFSGVVDYFQMMKSESGKSRGKCRKKPEKSILILQKSTQLPLVDNFRSYIVAIGWYEEVCGNIQYFCV